jgi:hypothetical protein
MMKPIWRTHMLVNRVMIGWLVALAWLWPGLVRAQEGSLREVIDREVKLAWGKEKIATPERSTDAVFLRRIYLDLVGMIPSYEETTEFLNDTDPKKRELLIDTLLADPRYSRNQGQVWDLNLLGRNPQNVGSPRNREAFRKWLATQFEKNEPYDRIVNKVLTAEEENSQLFYAQFRGSADDTTTSVMRVFLGTQLQCAKCHDHPFDSWTQRDYYGMTGFFVRTLVVEAVGANNDKNFVVGEKSTGDVTFTGSLMGLKAGAVPMKTPNAKAEPVKPKFLGGAELEEPELPKDFQEPKLKDKEVPPKPLFSRRAKAVEWITAKENPYLAKAAVNRIWAQFMGRGFVHPVDDFNSNNNPSLPELLRALEQSFVAHHYDVKWLIREIVTSEAYQAVDVGPSEDAMPKFYERARVRPLSVEELTASLHVATGLGVESALKSVPSEQMLKYLGEPTDGQGTFQGSLSEHLFLHNGDGFRSLCRPNKDNLPDRLLRTTDGWEAKVNQMFLSVLNRSPTSEERERFVSHLNVDTKDQKLAAQRMEEAMWVLVSCSEFRFNR